MQKISLLLCLLIFSFPVFAKQQSRCSENFDEHIGVLYDCTIGLKFKIPIFHECSFDKSDLPALLAWLNQHAEVKSLDLNDFDLSDEDVLPFAENKHLEWLSVSYNHLGNKGMAAIAKIPKLTFLYARMNVIGDEGAIALAQNTSLKYLDISFNRVKSSGIIAVAKLPHLDYLQASGSHVGDEGAMVLAKNPMPTHLYLMSADIGSQGAVALATMPGLTDLDLSYNQVDDTGAIALANNTVLRWLYVDHNGISAKGIAALKQNTTLIELSFGDDDKAAASRKIVYATTNSPHRGQVVKSCLKN
jgi:hypothetical protein